jgi:GTP cyclohydrolase I
VLAKTKERALFIGRILVFFAASSRDIGLKVLGMKSDSNDNFQGNPQASSRPDVALQKPVLGGTLFEVGMSEIQVPVKVTAGVTATAAVVDAFVSLDDPAARGIHMSRIFASVQSHFAEKVLSPSMLEQAAMEFLNSQSGLSQRARLKVSFPLMIQRKALVSEAKGWRSYPVSLEVQLDKGSVGSPQVRNFLEVAVVYSSTCPASGALARQLVQESFLKKFGSANLNADEIGRWLGSEQGMVATPHAQRSFAKLRVEISKSKASMQDSTGLLAELIDGIENVLQTPVQTFVKRVDEQEFAFRNGQNLMFCEDAARRVQDLLQKMSGVISFTGELRHSESLHPHDAVARIQSSVADVK